MDGHKDQQQFNIFANKEGGFESVFNENYPEAYATFHKLLFSYATKFSLNMRVLDIGCGDGWTAFVLASLGNGHYFGVDPSSESLRRFNSRLKQCTNLSVFLQGSSAEWILQHGSKSTISQSLGGSPKLIICNAALHQIRKTYEDLDSILRAFANLLVPGGHVIIGEYYFPPTVSSKDLASTYEWIRTTTGQNPTPANGYPDPDHIRAVLEGCGLQSVDEDDVQANNTLPFRYRGILMQKTKY